MGRRMAIWIFVVVFSTWVSIDKNRCVLFRGSASTSDSGGALALVAGPSPNPAGLVNDFYRISCPSAESIIQTTVHELERNFSNVAPALLRMVFHDCFVQGCDASILLGIVEGFWPEKEAFPNSKSLRGYEFIATIKARLESACPLTVSCADIIALSARDAVAMMGGPFFTLPTGRRDGTRSIATVAEANLPSPDEDVERFTKKFKTMGFDDRDVVSLLGAHTIGRAHCRFVEVRLTNFRGTGKPDPTINPSFAEELRSMCNRSDTRMDPLVPMDNGSDRDFDVHYYQNILAGKGLLHVDQALNASEHTRTFVNAYAADKVTFFNDFSRAMVKLTSLNVLTGRQGQIRKNCSMVESGGQYIEPEIIP